MAWIALGSLWLLRKAGALWRHRSNKRQEQCQAKCQCKLHATWAHLTFEQQQLVELWQELELLELLELVELQLELVELQLWLGVDLVEL